MRIASAAPLVVGLLLRVVLLVSLPDSSRYTADSPYYFALAENLIEGRGFSSAEHPPFAPSIERPPAYPAFVALIWKLSGRSHVALSLAQIGLDVWAIGLISGAGRRRYGSAGTWAAWIYACLIFPAGVSIQFMSEGLAMFGVAMAIYGHVRAVEAEKPAWWALLSGLAWSLATLSRSYLAPLAAIAGLLLVWDLRRLASESWKRAVSGFVVLGLGAGIPVSAWIARNAYVASTTDQPFVLLERFGSRDVFIKMYTPEFRAWYKSYDEPFYWTDWRQAPRANYLSDAERAEVEDLFASIAANQGTVTATMSERFAAITEERFRQAPFRLYIWRPISIALKFWISPRASAIRFAVATGSKLSIASPAITGGLFATNLLFFGLALLGIWLRRSADAAVLWVLPLALTTILTVIVHRESRLVMPLFPIVALASGLGAAGVWQKIRGRWLS